MKSADIKLWAKEEVADGLIAWAKERYDDPLLEPDGKDAIHKQLMRTLTFLGQERKVPQWWWELK